MKRGASALQVSTYPFGVFRVAAWESYSLRAVG